MKKPIENYGFAEEIVKVVRPIIDALEQNNIAEVESKISKLCLDICDKIENKILSPKEGDDYFTLLDLFITDNYPKLELKKEIKDILFEGMILHDYGKDYGANLKTMKMLAEKNLDL